MKYAAIVFGGKSGEHEVSCLSATSVLRAIDRSKFIPVPLGINRNGRWFLQAEQSLETIQNPAYSLSVSCDPESEVFFQAEEGFFTKDKKLQVDLVFPVLHGSFGEDGCIQGLLEILDIPYVGSGVLGSSVGMDKHLAKQLWEAAGIPIVPYVNLHHDDFNQNPQRAIETIIQNLQFPVFIKPANGGSSVGIQKCFDKDDLSKTLESAFAYDTKVLIESYIDAIEVECSVLGNHIINTFPPASIEPKHDYYDYDAKYTDPNGAEFHIPANLPDDVQNTIRSLAARAFRAVEARGLSRVDFFLCRQSGNIYINEINTLPGFTNVSLFPRMCAEGGISYPQLITTLFELAEEEHKRRSSLKYDTK